jgi:CPA2 family monovalent cation:H+ antiporter-2
MTELRHLIAATDLSEPSLLAVDRGYHLAATSAARLTLLTALGVEALAPLQAFLGREGAGLAQEIIEREREELSRLAADPARNLGVSASLRVEPGSALSAITAYADASDADLILTGAQGRGFISRFVFGSTASRLVRKSRCPVLVVRNPCRGAYRQVLVAVDFSPASALALALARAVAPEAHLFLLNVFELPFEGMLSYSSVRNDLIEQYRLEARREALDRLAALAAGAGLRKGQFSLLAQQGEAGGRIAALEAEQACDLVVMGKHGLHVTEELLLGSLTSRVIAASRADVLVVVDKRRPLPGTQVPGGAGRPAASPGTGGGRLD